MYFTTDPLPGFLSFFFFIKVAFVQFVDATDTITRMHKTVTQSLLPRERPDGTRGAHVHPSPRLGSQPAADGGGGTLGSTAQHAATSWSSRTCLLMQVRFLREAPLSLQKATCCICIECLSANARQSQRGEENGSSFLFHPPHPTTESGSPPCP